MNVRTLQDPNYRSPFQSSDTQKSKAETSTGNIRQICADNQNFESSGAAELRPMSPNTGNIVKRIWAGHIAVTAFIDPGSDRSLVRSSVARSLGSVESRPPLTLRGFGGGFTASTEIIVLPPKIDDTENFADIYVVADNLLPEDILLGRDILCRPDVRLVIESGGCRIERIERIQLPDNNKQKLQALLENLSTVFQTVSKISDKQIPSKW